MTIHVTPSGLAAETETLLAAMGVQREIHSGGTLAVRSPITGEAIAQVRETDQEGAERVIDEAHAAFLAWRNVPAPRRGELVRLLGEELRAHKAALGRLVSIEVGKIASEGLGEVQEMIDICDYAVGLSRQLYGLTIATERADHRMVESWHPLGVAGIISAFNFPVAVWSWNAALALVCGNAVVWKPSEKAPLSALAAQALLGRAMRRFTEAGGMVPDGLSGLLIGERDIGEALVEHPRVPLVSATGSTAMGRAVGPRLAAALRARASRTRRQQRRDRLPIGGSRPCAARHRVRRHGHRRAALHHAAPPVRARQHLRGARAAPSARLCLGGDRRPARPRHA